MYRGRCGGGNSLRVYEVGILGLFVSLQGLKDKVHVFKIDMYICVYACACIKMYTHVYIRTHPYMYV